MKGNWPFDSAYASLKTVNAFTVTKISTSIFVAPNRENYNGDIDCNFDVQLAAQAA
jgi:hypothetical protein